MELSSTFHHLGLALGLGLLVGLQRERVESKLAGFRTFPLITVLGTLCALLGQQFGGWIVGLGFVGLAALTVAGILAEVQTGKGDVGLTTEAALLVMFTVGAYIPVGSTAVATVVGAGVAVLLHLKPQMHAIAGKIGDKDFMAIMQFVIITLVILPVLPNRAFDPFAVFNPFKAWLMVVLIVGISLGGYVIYKMFGDRVGTVAAGILGGLISSTATTVSYARRTKDAPDMASLAILVILLASTVLYGRVLFLMGAISPVLAQAGFGPFVVILLVALALCLFSWFTVGQHAPQQTDHGNPSELRSALMFAGIYILVLFAVAVGRKYFGDRGLLAVSIISGLTDVDAITLSLSQLVSEEKLPAGTAWRFIIVASMSNLVFKAGIATVLSGRKLFGRIAVMFGLLFLASLLVVLLWP